MSGLILTGATSGTITVNPAAIAGTNTLTVPAETGTLRTSASTGTVLQIVTFQTGALATGTTTIPTDDTIPQITEGDQYMTLAITPRSATSKLIINVVWIGAHSVSTATNVVALFQDATANALAAIVQPNAFGNGIQLFSFTHSMTSGTTSATTFRVRAGSGSAGTFTFNGAAAARLLGGVNASSITITEVVA